jgi:hypothetical protein
MKYSLKLVILCACIIPFGISNSSAQKKEKEDEDHLEFSHPIFTESISPDTKIRFNYINTKAEDSLSSHGFDLEMEYSPVPAFSLHLDIPYTVLKPKSASTLSHLEDIELALKFANFAFAKHKVLLGYGVSLGFPTGNDLKGIGSGHIFSIDPFLNGGVMWRRWEWTAYFTFDIPTNQRQGEDLQTGLESRLTALYHVDRRWELLVEAGNSTEIGHTTARQKNYDIAEGIKLRPNPEKPWFLALGVRQPLGDNTEFKFQGMFSLFYHFED